MIQDQILAEIDATLSKLRRAASANEANWLYEQLGRKVTGLRSSSVAYRRSERKKGARIREELRAKEKQG